MFPVDEIWYSFIAISTGFVESGPTKTENLGVIMATGFFDAKFPKFC